jgi:hypothetical protein
MKLLQLIQAEDEQPIYIKAENLIAFSPYGEGAAIELTTGSVFVVKELPKTIMAMLNIASGGELTLIDRVPIKSTVIDNPYTTI